MSGDNTALDETRKQMEAGLLAYIAKYGIELDAEQKHALLYGFIPDAMTLLTKREQAARQVAWIEAVKVAYEQTVMGYTEGEFIDNCLAELRTSPNQTAEEKPFSAS